MTQWRAPKLGLYTDLGPLELLTAYTPAHSLPRTLSFRTPINELHLSSLLTGARFHPNSPPPNVLVDVDDVEQLMNVQREIEAGWRYSLVFEPEARGTYVQAPLLRLPPEVRA
jgi:hypothetical protein